MLIQFPSSFLWGAAISSYQCEGQNFNSDWSLWEKQRGLDEAGKACDHYNRFQEDSQIAKQLNLNSFRFSIEWSRVCPRKGRFSQEAIEHYKQVLDALAQQGIKPVVTLHHFTNPIWFSDSGGWVNKDNIIDFIFYLKKIVDELKDKVDTWIIFNEPLVYLYKGFIEGAWPPGKKSLFGAKKVIDNITEAYCTGYRDIKHIYKGIDKQVRVSIAKNLRVFRPCCRGIKALNSIVANLRNRYFNFWLLNKLYKSGCLDFIGVNYYCCEYDAFKGILGSECGHKTHQVKQNYLGWNIDAEGFYEVLIALKKFDLPVIITENGTAENKNSCYEEFLYTHLKALARAQSKGVKIQGYMWWSLLDNFEWDKGFGPRFGLVYVNYDTMQRSIKPFAYDYAKIAKKNAINI